MSEAEFSAYVERVFRHHNRVVNNLLFAVDHEEKHDDAQKASSAASAEANMAHACLPVNDIVTSVADGHAPNLWQKMTLADAVAECEAATRRMEAFLAPDL